MSDREYPKPVKITVSDPDTGEVFEERVCENDYCLITAGIVTVKHINVMGRTHMIAVGPPTKERGQRS